MKQVIDFNSGQVVKVTDENVGGILIDIKVLTAVPAVAVIADLSIVPLQIQLKRKGQSQPVDIVNDYLEYVLRGYHSGSTRYDISTTARTEGYYMKIPFDGDLNLHKGDELTVQMKCPTAAFTNMVEATSNITIETIPAVKSSNPVITRLRSHTYGSGNDQINETLGSNIVKITLVHDLGADYLASTEAKPTNGIIIEANNFSKDASENLLIQENLDMLQLNPETPVQDLVIYNSMQALNNVKYRAKYNKAVLNSARIMLLERVVV